MRKKRFLLVMLLLLGIGFATVSTTLLMSGNVNISTNNDDFDVIFTKAVIDGVNSPSKIIESGKKITFETKDLVNVGDISKLDFEVTNNSTMYDAEVSIDCTAAGDKSSYYEITKEIASPIVGKATGVGKVEVKLKKASIENLSETFTCTLTAIAKERTTKSDQAPTTSFAEDSWVTIGKAVKSGIYPYQVGDTKTVNMGSLGTHTVRIANTTPCTTETSQTACGFVVEFADIITTHKMNPDTPPTNVGGWPASEARTYLNNDILNALPSDLQAVIADTTVVSGHGSTAEETNFTSTDKLYLLSTKEVYGNDGTSSIVNSETAEAETRQLDYYNNLGVTVSNNIGAKKNNDWWLRSAYPMENYNFFSVTANGWFGVYASLITSGLSPAFRIA